MSGLQQTIKTFAILDLEVNNLPKHQFNQCSLTELCIYGISVKHFQNDILNKGRVVKNAPAMPRVINRINIMINPMRRIHDGTTTGLDNYMLENESPFDQNTAECILKFINRLEKPVCLVAHNGFNHDFRLIRHVYEKINVELPSDLYCIDSLFAFRRIDIEIDRWCKANSSGEGGDPLTATTEAIAHCSKNSADNQVAEASPQKEEYQNNNENVDDEIAKGIYENIVKSDEQKNWQAANESTPKNKPILKLCDSKQSAPRLTAPISNVRRQLFETNCDASRSYILGELYKSVFVNRASANLHQAEGDVKVLTKLMLHYGKAFVEYAEQNKIQFAEVPKLGTANLKDIN